MKKDVLGVIGGLGPLATAGFLEEVARMTRAETEQDHVDMIVYNFPSIPDRTGYILGSNLRSPLPGLLWAARGLHREGVSAIAIPCVTAHYFHRDLREAVPVTVLDALEETALCLKAAGVTRAGIMATQGTVHAGLLTGALMEQGIAPVLPLPQGQEDVNHLIYNCIKQGVPAEADRFRRAEEDLRRRGAEVVVLGCTELSLLRRQTPLGPGFLDVTQVLAGKAITQCGKEIKPEYQTLITA